MCEGLSETCRHSVACYFHFFFKNLHNHVGGHMSICFACFSTSKTRGWKGEVRGACFLTHRRLGFIIFRLGRCTIEQLLSLAELRNRWQCGYEVTFVQLKYLRTFLPFILLTQCYTLHLHSWHRTTNSENTILHIRISQRARKKPQNHFMLMLKLSLLREHSHNFPNLHYSRKC